MYFKALLKLEGEEFEIIKASYELGRDTDAKGQPSNQVRGGKINFQVKSSAKTILWEWIINQYAQKDGEIEFYKRDDPSAAKVLKFEEAYIVHYEEDFDISGARKEQPTVENFTISARVLTMEPGGTFENTDWT